MPRFKADLHIHNASDPREIEYGPFGLVSPYTIIDKAFEKGYEILSFTNHNNLHSDSNITNYAHSKGILLIPGVELNIEKKHVLLYNIKDYMEIDSFESLRNYRDESSLIVAPHPFYPTGSCLRDALIEYIDCFDAVEYSHFYTRFWNPNKKAVCISDHFKKTIIGSSDTHCIAQFGSTYSLIDATELSIPAIIHAVKNGNAEVVSEPLSVLRIAWIMSVLGMRFVHSLVTGRRFIRNQNDHTKNTSKSLR
ncbi:MAG: hypothetical protein C4541_04090 [Candidatus Auribacter fodinae]|jgi:predicted metal-dependent phosphoesterase TrpH|uniref:Polymerase/histidinol phosphatase N-terminal domain-containing protein n=1 Tax=Candidatus Auribacter fodinae TaxID=2093366 RepID=A0A3A4R2T5_9BACT|nr:MAG: hypothetical protein C4541_04090 [Candidatus Auribacter fodinae]